jgi:hypothetical protein
MDVEVAISTLWPLVPQEPTFRISRHGPESDVGHMVRGLKRGRYGPDC